MKHTFLGLNLSVIAIALSTTISAAKATTNQEPSWNGETIKVGTIDNYLPCSDQINQHYEGFSIDLWRRISERLNLKYTIQPIASFDQAITLAAQGEFDVIASCHEITILTLHLKVI